VMSPVFAAYATLISAVRDAHAAPISDVDSGSQFESSFSETTSTLPSPPATSHGSDSESIGIPEVEVDISVDVAELALREEDEATVRSEGRASSSPTAAVAQCEEDCVLVFPATGRQISPNNALITTRSALLQSHSTTPSNGSISPCGHFKRNRLSNQRKTRQCVCGHCNMQWVEVNIKRLNKTQQRAVHDLPTVVPFDASFLPSEVVRDIGMAATAPTLSMNKLPRATVPRSSFSLCK